MVVGVVLCEQLLGVSKTSSVFGAEPFTCGYTPHPTQPQSQRRKVGRSGKRWTRDFIAHDRFLVG